MKKKGLIISTIVMVVVLIASLTTATYAWFQASSVTSIEGFNVSIASNNAVNIGMRKASSFLTGEGLTTAGFWTDSVTFTATGAGQIGGTWAGDTEGLSANMEHDILWGAQTKAIGFATEALTISSDPENVPDGPNAEGTLYYQETLKTNLHTIASPAQPTASTRVYAANMHDQWASKLANVTLANANKNGVNEGDYAYLFLGASPTKALTTNNLVVTIDMSLYTGSTVGIMSAVHVAYRYSINGAAATNWVDVDLFGSIHQNAQMTSLAKGKIKNANVAFDGEDAGDTALATAVESAYNSTYGTAMPAKSATWVLTGLSTTADYIDQIELLIYIDGNDSDCINAGIGSNGAIKIYFYAE